MKALVSLLVVILPFHSVFVSGFGAAYFVDISFWKEIVILLMVAWVLMSRKKLINGKEVYLNCVVIFAIFYYVAIFFVSPSLGSFAALKNFVGPMLVFLCVLNSRLSSRQEQDILILFERVALISVIYALIQVHLLGDGFLLSAGFPANEWNAEKLKFSFYINESDMQRANGGFSGPIIFAIYLTIALILSYERNMLKLKLPTIVYLLGIVSTMVRSAMLAILIVFIMYYTRSATKLVNRNNFFYILLAVVCGAYFLLTYQAIYDAVYQLWLNSFGGAHDPSKVGHMMSYQRGLSLFYDNPVLGGGLGSYGPLSVLYFDNGEVIESSILSSFLELGIVGGVITFLPFIFIFYLCKAGVGRKVIMVFFLVGIFLPIQYYVELNLLVMVVLGIQARRSMVQQR